MGDTQVGGNLSVHWLVNADDVDPGDETTFIGSRRVAPGRREWVQHGADHHRNSAGSGRNFTVRVKLPADAADADRFLTSVKEGLEEAKAKGRLEFELIIEKTQIAHTQIQVAWGPGQPVAWSDGLAGVSSGGTTPGRAE